MYTVQHHQQWLTSSIMFSPTPYSGSLEKRDVRLWIGSICLGIEFRVSLP